MALNRPLDSRRFVLLVPMSFRIDGLHQPHPAASAVHVPADRSYGLHALAADLTLEGLTTCREVLPTSMATSYRHPAERGKELLAPRR